MQGSGSNWLFPLVDGHPPIGWHDALCYLVLPVVLVISQVIVKRGGGDPCSLCSRIRICIACMQHAVCSHVPVWAYLC